MSTELTYRDKALLASGIREESQKSLMRKPVISHRSAKKHGLDEDAFFRSARSGNAEDQDKPQYTEEIIDRYRSGTFNQKWEPTGGDDMVMIYLDLNRQIMQYVPPKWNTWRNYYRVRYENPALHTDQNGDPMKYQSPPGSGTFLWLPEAIIAAFESGTEIETLVVTEGEKKADKLCQESVWAVGVSGIHNIAIKNQLPREFEQLIKKCKVKNIVFLLDSDLYELSLKKGKPANSRPHNFMAAVKNFRDYFRAYANMDIDLEIFYGYNFQNKENEKGIDDLLAGSLKGKEAELSLELKELILDKYKEGKYLKLLKITSDSETKIKQYFHLANAHDFYAFYKEKLKEFGEKFKFWNTEWRIRDNGSIELAQALMDEERYWDREIEIKGEKTRDIYTFNYYNCYNFLAARGFGRYPLGDQSEGDFIYVKKDVKVLAEVKPHNIKDYINEFTESMGEIKVLNMLYRGGKYLGPDSISNLKYVKVDFIPPSKDYQFLYFNNNYWKISDSGIEEHSMNDLPGFVWKDKVIGFEPKLIPDFFKVESITKDNTLMYGAKISDECQNCHYFQFLYNTSRVHWRETHPIDPEATPVERLSFEKEYEQAMHLYSKMTAIGYLLHSYRDPSKTKAVVAMDNKISEVGTSNGRSGKSLLGVALERMVPSVFIDGKKKNMEQDPFLWEEVDERTDIIWVDDVDKSLDFEFFFTIITGRLTINRKGKSKFKISKDQTPKLLITTNHAIAGDSDSFVDRQILLAFSDYYNAQRKPVDEFGLLFDDWDAEQWNLFYNFMASCLQMYFQHGLIQAPNNNLVRRRLRQEMGEDFLSWAEDYFHESGNKLNSRLPKDEMYNHIIEAVPSFKKWMKPYDFKKRLKKFCEYKTYRFNPVKKGLDDKSNGQEYITIATSGYVVCEPEQEKILI
jgi:DNA primase